MTQEDKKGMEERLWDEFVKHPAIKAADAAIVLQAIRTSGKGYEGPPLKDAFIHALKEKEKEVKATLLKEIREKIDEAKAECPEGNHEGETMTFCEVADWNSALDDIYSSLDSPR